MTIQRKGGIYMQPYIESVVDSLDPNMLRCVRDYCEGCNNIPNFLKQAIDAGTQQDRKELMYYISKKLYKK